MTKPLLLDTFCKAGGAAMGYHLAGYEVVGVDIEPQPNYPFQFIQADAIEYIRTHGHRFDVIHASPPCQGHSKAGKGCIVSHGKEYIDLIPATRQALEAVQRPYIIENVPFSGIRPDLKLFGYAFGLPVIRERWFELGGGIWAMCPVIPRTHLQVSNGDLVTVAGNGHRLNRRRQGHRMVYVHEFKGWRGNVVDTWSHALEIHWMKTARELANAIPPAYTQHIGAIVLPQLKSQPHVNHNHPTQA
jgi:DNA (cytosine-5)-methyltransferase 1